jgi:hypothetical protein
MYCTRTFSCENWRHVRDWRPCRTGFLFIFYVIYSALLHLPPFSSTVSEDARIEPRTVPTLAEVAGQWGHIITINVPLILKIWEIIFFLRANYFMGHFEGYFEGAKTF